MSFIPDPVLLNSLRGRQALTNSPELHYTAPKLVGDIHTNLLVIGGGFAGISLLTHLAHVQPELLKETLVIDREGRYARRFFKRTDSIGQRTLRSPYEHHLGVHNHGECELIDYARFHWEHLSPIERGQVRMAQGGNRSVVPMDLFESHTNHTIACHGLNHYLRQGEVQKIQRQGQHYFVTGQNFSVSASAVVLCTGEARNDQHEFSGYNIRPWDSGFEDLVQTEVAVSGGGLTAAYLISELLKRNNKVHWINRSQYRYQCSDVDAKFFRPEGRTLFRKANPEEQDAMLGLHRRSSIMFEFRPQLEAALAEQQLIEHVDSSQLSLEVQIITAHGTLPELPEIDLSLAAPLRNGRLPVDYGFRVMESDPLNMFVLGTHAVYASGPAARNIDGIRFGAEMVAQQLSEEASND